ncbi:hypothetical protein B1759_14945 [Rubrivirga sp. SAORIC476]|uniref:phage tail length tape measure family protein n=1 Tax=Rubrivirga sp. SAORIC476 TaxID=1961794 RepID=UPI000BA8FFFC|nr:phage tail length tape measure family protein [Rubrivirga sp. SAORIC476]PAP79615.1 hypothetical protein B1759_14945 [Rubrivirga sp. SAORIC476]
MLGELKVRIGADLSSMRKAFREANGDVVRLGRQMQGVGKSMSAYVTAPIVALGALSVRAWDKQAKAIAAVENGIRSTGGVAGRTIEQLTAQASELQQTSLFGDEEILTGVTQQMLTFGKVAGDQFDRAQVAVLDLSAKLGTDLQSSAIMVGKALNDPVRGITAMSRAGVQFSDSQKEVIKNLAETGRIAEAQNLILDELEVQYGGTAAAAARAGTGPLKQFTNNVGDLSEQFGQLILVALNPVINLLNDLTLRFQALPVPVKASILVVAGLAAAAGPLLVALGTLLVVLPKIRAALLAVNRSTLILTAKIIAITAVVAAFAAAAYLIYKNWAGISAFFRDLWQGVVSATTAAMGLVQARVEGAFLRLIRTMSGLGAKLLEPARRVAEALGADDVASTIEGVQARIENIVSPEAVAASAANVARLSADLRSAGDKIGDTFQAAGGSIRAELAAATADARSAVAGAMATMDDLGSGVGESVAAAAGDVSTATAETRSQLDGIRDSLRTTLLGIERMTEAGQMTPLDAGRARLDALRGAMASAAQVAGGDGAAAFRRYADEFRSMMAEQTAAFDLIQRRAPKLAADDVVGRFRLPRLAREQAPGLDESQLEMAYAYRTAFVAIEDAVVGVAQAVGDAVGEMVAFRNPLESLKAAAVSLGQGIIGVFSDVAASIAAAIAKALILKGLSAVFNAGTGGIGGFIGSAIATIAGGAGLSNAVAGGGGVSAGGLIPAISVNVSTGGARAVPGGIFIPHQVSVASVRTGLQEELRIGSGPGVLQ